MPTREVDRPKGDLIPRACLAAAWIFAAVGGALSYRWAVTFFFQHDLNAESLPPFQPLILGSLSGALCIFFAFQVITRGRLQAGLFAAFAGIGLPIFGIAWALGSRLLGAVE